MNRRGLLRWRRVVVCFWINLDRVTGPSSLSCAFDNNIEKSLIDRVLYNLLSCSPVDVSFPSHSSQQINCLRTDVHSRLTKSCSKIQQVRPSLPSLFFPFQLE